MLLLPIAASSARAGVQSTGAATSQANLLRMLPQDRITLHSDIKPILEATLEMIETSNAQVTGIADRIIVLCGKSGRGKSTLLNVFAREQLISCKKPNAKREFFLEGGTIAQIGHKSSSQTQIPQKAEIDGAQYWDCPGFGDTRGPVVDISNSFAINKLLTSPNEVKIIAVIEETDVTSGKGQHFKELIASLDTNEKVLYKLDALAMQDLAQLKGMLTSFRASVLAQTQFPNHSIMLSSIKDELFAKIFQIPAFEEVMDSIAFTLNELQNLVGYFTSFFEKILPCTSQNCEKLQNGEFIGNIVHIIEAKIKEHEQKAEIEEGKAKTKQLEIVVTAGEAKTKQLEAMVTAGEAKTKQLEAMVTAGQTEVVTLRAELSSLKVHSSQVIAREREQTIITQKAQFAKLVSEGLKHREQALTGPYGHPHHSIRMAGRALWSNAQERIIELKVELGEGWYKL